VQELRGENRAQRAQLAELRLAAGPVQQDIGLLRHRGCNHPGAANPGRRLPRSSSLVRSESQEGGPPRLPALRTRPTRPAPRTSSCSQEARAKLRALPPRADSLSRA